MKYVGVTMRVHTHSETGERRDCIDQNWVKFLGVCDLMPIFIPNQSGAIQLYPEDLFDGFVLTGGNSLEKYGGDAPERDQLEKEVLLYSLQKNVPTLGVCRGMQVIIDHFGSELIPVEGHVRTSHTLDFEGQKMNVNSYHDFGIRDCCEGFKVDARAKDGVIEAISCMSHPIKGIMWHPEREEKMAPHDIALFRKHFSV